MGPSVSARLCSALLCCLGWIAALRGPAVAGPCVLALPVSALAAAFTSEAFLTALVLLGCPPREAHWKARGQLPMPGTRCRLHRGAETQPPCPSRPWLPAPPSGSAAGLAVGGEGGAAPQLCRAWEEVPSSVVWQAEWGGRGVSFSASTPAWAGPLGGLHLPALRVPCPRSAGSVAITRGLVSSPILVLVSFRHLVPFTAARWGRSRRSEGCGHASGPLDWTVGLRGSCEVSLAPAQLQLLCDGHSVTERDSLSSPLAHVASLVMEVGVRPEHCLLWRRACGEPLGTLPALRLPGGPRLSWLEPAQLRSCLSVLRPSFLALTAFLCRKSKNRRPRIETP